MGVGVGVGVGGNGLRGAAGGLASSQPHSPVPSPAASPTPTQARKTPASPKSRSSRAQQQQQGQQGQQQGQQQQGQQQQGQQQQGQQQGQQQSQQVQQRQFRELARSTMVRFGLQRGLAEVMAKGDVEASLLACAAVVAMVGPSAERAELVCHGTGLVEALLHLMETKAVSDRGDKRLLVEALACLVALRGVIEGGLASSVVSLGIRCKIVLRKGLHMLDDMLSAGHPAACGEGKGDRDRLARSRSVYARGMKMHHELSLVPDSSSRDGSGCRLA